MTGHRLPLALLCAAMLAAGTASAATLKTLKSFCATGGTHCTDGSVPASQLVADASGTLYGSTFGGGAYGGGTIFALVPNVDRSAWTYEVLRNFCPKVTRCLGGQNPVGRLVIDAQGSLYGVTKFGGHGANPGSGTVFKLTPEGKHKTWALAVLYRFCIARKCADGALPDAGLTYAGAQSGLPFDGTSPLYGTTTQGGAHGKGTAFKMIFAGGVAMHRTIYDFCAAASCTDGWWGHSLTVDGSGNIVGTALLGGAHQSGVVFKLSPAAEDAWTETVLHDFDSVPGSSRSSVLIDGTGAMFGLAGNGKAGVLYRLSGSQYAVLHTFCQQANCADGGVPSGDLAMDASGDLFGTTELGGANRDDHGGTVFRFGGGDYSVLYSFCAEHKCRDGSNPTGGVVLDGASNLLGTTGEMGENGSGGTVFTLTP